MRKRLRNAALPMIVLLAGCASTHNLKTDGSNLFGGGFLDQELRPGLHQMTARSNLAIWPSFAAAQATWRARANELCGKDAYRSFDATSDAGRGPAVPLTLSPGAVVSTTAYAATMTGYVLCDSVEWSVEDAKHFVQAEKARQQRQANERISEELAELGGEDCAADPAETSAESQLRRGTLLMQRQHYAAARACFVRAQQSGPGSDPYRKACESLGLLYEVGLGVGKDLRAAQDWYRKAGL